MASTIRQFVLAVAALAATLILAACADRPGELMLKPVAATDVGKKVNVLVATTRERSTTDQFAFTNDRAAVLSYEEYTISVPPDHVPGKIEWPAEPPGNPAKNFVVTKATSLDETGFNANLFDGKVASGDVAVFVHGYNTNYQEGVFRVAQLLNDSQFPGEVVAFSWPSRGTLTGYVADRESSTYSRDYLETFLNNLARQPKVKRIHIIAHSMGNWLAVETIRQAKIRGQSPFLRKLGEVFLMSPDIDVDVFRTQLDAIGSLKEPITIGVSEDDRALHASQRLAGDVPRVGNVLLDNPRTQMAIKLYGLRVIDMRDAKSADALNHSKFLSILPALREVTTNDTMVARGNAISRTGLFVANTAGAILQAPLQLGEAVSGQ